MIGTEQRPGSPNTTRPMTMRLNTTWLTKFALRRPFTCRSRRIVRPGRLRCTQDPTISLIVNIDERSSPPSSQFVADLRMGQHRKEAGAADHIADKGGQHDARQSMGKCDFAA